ncbi:MAG: tetratricopeptide repeat protein, partial [Myxococcota bacterium]|nr:tetratricopeptide repeat protein [Myxococcota bacterium]
DHEDATRLMKELLYERESWEDLVPILEAEFAQLEAKNQKADIAWELARLNRDKLGRKREAVGWLRKGYEARREHPEIVGALVEHYMDAQLWEQAEPLLSWYVSFLEAKRQYADLAVFAHRLGELHEAEKRPKKAIEAYKRAYQADSQRIITMMTLGRLLLEDEKPEKALQTLQGLLLVQQEMTDPSQKVEMLLLLVRAELAVGEESKARRHLKRLLQLAPDHPEAIALQTQI